MAQALHNKLPKTMERPRQLKKPLTLLSPLDEDEDSKQRRRWRKGVSSPPLLTPESNRDDDPFAGMTSGVNYEQEIERLKALVPKVDSKKRRPRSAGGERKTKPVLARRTSPPTRPSTETTPSSSPYYDTSSRVTSPSLSTPRSLSPAQSDYTSMTIPPVPEEDEEEPQQSVITEEEKARFLEFMRSWTGGWKEWERNEDDGHCSGMESVRSGGSLWAEQQPWTKYSNRRRCSWQEGPRRPPLTVTLPDRKFDISMRSEPCTPLLAPR